MSITNLKDNTKIYECDKSKCKECNGHNNMYGLCHLTTDLMKAKNPDKYITVMDLKISK